jgi:hypothetical protein
MQAAKHYGKNTGMQKSAGKTCACQGGAHFDVDRAGIISLGSLGARAPIRDGGDHRADQRALVTHRAAASDNHKNLSGTCASPPPDSYVNDVHRRTHGV